MAVMRSWRRDLCGLCQTIDNRRYGRCTMTRIAICAPPRRFTREDAARVEALAAAEFPGLELQFHPQCFATDGHFAGPDDAAPCRASRMRQRSRHSMPCGSRAAAMARTGSPKRRLHGWATRRRTSRSSAIRTAAICSAALYRARIGQPVHAPMPVDIRRDGRRGGGAPGAGLPCRAIAAGLNRRSITHPAVAFNLMTLAMLCGTPLMPGLAGHVVMVEEVSEHLYAIDRLFFHVTAHLGGIAGLRLGRVSDVPENDRPFGARARGNRALLVRAARAFPSSAAADIGHDAANRIVPFGLATARDRRNRRRATA